MRPLVAYTYVGDGREGTCYRAAGWTMAGTTTPGADGTASRAVWMRPLEPGWEETPPTGPERRIGEAPAPHVGTDGDWASREFGRGGLADGRLRRRIVAMARAWGERPGQAVSAVFQDEAGRKAAYRLLSNGNVTMDDILETHIDMTVARCLLEGTVLALQDTTMLNHDAQRASTTGLAVPGMSL